MDQDLVVRHESCEDKVTQRRPVATCNVPNCRKVCVEERERVECILLLRPRDENAQLDRVPDPPSQTTCSFRWISLRLPRAVAGARHAVAGPG